jgi:N6-adenosine-specific RNA methylase IME4
MPAWGFHFSTFAFTWIKLRRGFDSNQLRLLSLAEWDLHFGLGLTTRKNSEVCLLGRRGNARRLAKNVPEIILAPVRAHSQKPTAAIGRIERYSAGPYATLFARSTRRGWDCWGDEVGKFGEDKI